MRTLITGGLGLVGVNYAAWRLSQGDKVVILDSFARGGSNFLNKEWLRAKDVHGNLAVYSGDVADRDAVRLALDTFRGVDAVVHCAAQSSVDKSMAAPTLDFRSNVMGTFTVLETLRTTYPEARFVFMASNKVFDVTPWLTQIRGTQWRFAGRAVGPGEDFPFHTDAREPYGASKICGMYYTRCYAAMYDMPTVVCVPSGMYGARQFGKEEQGWLGWFIIATALGLPITIKGDGFQVRDMLDVRDVNRALDLLIDQAPKNPGYVYNLGGGPRNAISLIEAIGKISDCLGTSPKLEYTDERPKDNRCYISNVGKLLSLGWYPEIGIDQGINDLCAWVRSERSDIEKLYTSGGK